MTKTACYDIYRARGFYKRIILQVSWKHDGWTTAKYAFGCYIFGQVKEMTVCLFWFGCHSVGHLIWWTNSFTWCLTCVRVCAYLSASVSFNYPPVRLHVYTYWVHAYHCLVYRVFGCSIMAEFFFLVILGTWPIPVELGMFMSSTLKLGKHTSSKPLWEFLSII